MSTTKKDWVASAKPIAIQVEGQSVVCTPRQFSSGSVGYNASGKVLIDGHKVQVGGNLVVVGSKDWPDA
jgi:hypothetical protein